MNQFQASTEQHELLNNEQESVEITNLAEPISDASEKTDQCEKRRLLLDEIEKLKIYRDEHLNEGERFYGWDSSDLSERSYKHTVQDVLAM